MNTISTLKRLQEILEELPDGTSSDVLASDLKAGNFEEVTFWLPDGSEKAYRYTGPVAEGYVSPHDAG